MVIKCLSFHFQIESESRERANDQSWKLHLRGHLQVVTQTMEGRFASSLIWNPATAL
jgi:hypothetical protein